MDRQKTSVKPSGVLHSGTAAARETLLEYMSRVLCAEHKKPLRQLMAKGAVSVNGRGVKRPDFLLCPGDAVTVLTRRASAALAGLAGTGLKILHEDDSLLVVYKPEGLLTSAPPGSPEQTAYVALNNFLLARKTVKHERVFALHRLDQRTSGLLIFPKSAAVREHFRKNWKSVEKTYLAVVEGSLSKPSGRIESDLYESSSGKVGPARGRQGAMRAVTHFRVLREAGAYSLLEVTLETGRKNQIRAHMAEIGHPIAGDAKYGAVKDPAGRLALHAFRLSFSHPVTEKKLSFVCPFPAELARIVPGKPLPE
jgi:23S rRNA pseudouridine1911/1915/1917 synthase